MWECGSVRRTYSSHDLNGKVLDSKDRPSESFFVQDPAGRLKSFRDSTPWGPHHR